MQIHIFENIIKIAEHRQKIVLLQNVIESMPLYFGCLIYIYIVIALHSKFFKLYRAQFCHRHCDQFRLERKVERLGQNPLGPVKTRCHGLKFQSTHRKKKLEGNFLATGNRPHQLLTYTTTQRPSLESLLIMEQFLPSFLPSFPQNCAFRSRATLRKPLFQAAALLTNQNGSTVEQAIIQVVHVFLRPSNVSSRVDNEALVLLNSRRKETRDNESESRDDGLSTVQLLRFARCAKLSRWFG